MASKKRGKRLLDALKKVNHLFAKLTVAWCVIWGTACSVYALRGYFRTGHNPSATLGIILGFLGGELLFLCLRTILNEKKKKNDENGKE